VRNAFIMMAINEITWRYIPESCHLHTRRRENLKCHISERNYQPRQIVSIHSVRILRTVTIQSDCFDLIFQTDNQFLTSSFVIFSAHVAPRFLESEAMTLLSVCADNATVLELSEVRKFISRIKMLICLHSFKKICPPVLLVT
jgi:hypothetical protein